jgi:DNA-binding response OmpR family regulator
MYPDRRLATAVDKRFERRGGRRAADFGNPCPTVILADSYDAARKLYSRFLDRYRFRVETATTGAELLDLLRREHPAVILCEPSLPGLSLTALAAELAAYRKDAGVEVLLLGDGRRLDPDLTSIVQPSAVLEKPFELSQLLEAVRRAIRIGMKAADSGHRSS